MKRITKHVVYTVLILITLTQCDSVSPSSDQTELKSVELSVPANDSEQSLEPELAWEQMKGAKFYRLLLSESDTFETSEMDTTITGTSITTPLLNPETTYNWKVFPIKKNQSGPWSEVWSFTTEAVEPAATPVTLLTPANNADKVSTDLEFTWEALSGISEYTYQLSDNSSFSSVITEKTITTTSYTAEGLKHQETYYWRVKDAGDATGDSWSNTWSFTTEAEEPAATPVTLLTPANNADKVSTDLEFTWDPLSGISEYTYQLSDNSTFSSVISEETVSATSYTAEGLEHETTYYWRVKDAGDTTGDSWSNTWSFTTEAEEPAATPVTLLTPANNADKVSTDLEFTWEALSGISEYTYQLSDNSTFSSVITEETVSATSYTAEGLEHQKKYYWRVKDAGDTTGDSWSEVWSFTTETEETDAETTTPVTLKSPVNEADNVSTDLEFTWEALSGISEYTYQLSDNSSFSSIITEKTITDTSYTPEGLEHETTYYWRVKDAGDTTGDSWSEVWSFTTETEETDPETTTPVTLKSPVNEADNVSTDLEFTWNALSGVSEYTYQLSDNSTFSSVITEETVSATSYTAEGLEHQKKYYWRVKDAGDTTGDSWSEVWSFTTETEETDPETTTPVTLKSPVNEADNVSTDLEFTWNALSGVSEYTYQLSDNSTFSSVITEETVSATSYTAEGLEHQKKYYWRVKDAGDTTGDSWSEVWSFTTETEEPAATPVTLLTPANNADKVSTDLEFTWEALSGISEYTYQLSDNSTFSSVITEEAVSGTSYTAEGLGHETTYYWRVKDAGDATGDSWSNTWSFTTETEEPAATPVTLLTPANNADKVSTDLEFTWEALSGISEYTYQLSDNSSFSSVITEKTITDTSYTPEGLLHQKKYYWRVKVAGDTTGDSWSNTWSFTTEAEEPAATPVTLLTPANNADKVSTDLEFTWNALSGISEYTYQLSDNSTFSSVITEEAVSGTSYSPAGLLHQETYYWRVKDAGDATGDTWSEVWSFTTEVEEPAATPVTLLTPANNADKVSTDLEFTWEALSEISEYTYQLSDNSSFSSVITEETITDTSYTPEGLGHQKKYYWRVKVAGDTTGDSWSNTWSFTTEAEEPAATPVTLLTPANNADKVSTDLEFTWEALSGISEYTYQLSDNSSFSSVITEKTITTTSYTAEGLGHETTYYWRVKVAGDATGDTWSEVWSFTTEAEEPAATPVTLLTPANNADKVSTDLEFTWNALSGVSEYTYQLSDNSSFSSIITEKTITDTSYTPEGLGHQKKYYWRVKVAGDTTGDSWSNTWSFTTEAEEPAATPVTLLTPANNADKVSTDLEFTWEALSGISEYTYQLSDNSSFSSVITEKTITTTSYTAEGLGHETTYYWRVKDAGDTTGDSWSEVWSFTTGISTTVTLLSPKDNAFDLPINPNFEWEEVTEANSYQFQLADNSSFSPLVDESVEFSTTYQASNLVYQTKYYWRVRVSGDSTPWSTIRSFTTMAEPNSPPPSSGSFVQVQNSNFVVDGNVLRFAGSNAYYLPNYEKLNPAVVDRAMDNFQNTGISVIRMWGFYDGYDCGYSKNDPNENVIQTSPGVFSESALRDLDNVIAKGKERGIRFIIPFINFWDELGGVCQYNTWAGASNPSTNMTFFMSNSDTQKWYKDYINMLLNRVNTVTGVAYKNEPAIAAWQIMNEGRNPGVNPTILRDWYRDIAQYIKSIDSNHLLSTGEEGFDDSSLGSWGNDGSFTHPDYSTDQYSNTYVLRASVGSSYVLNTAIPEIDFGNAHWYPSEYGFGTTIDDDLLQAQRAWLNDHQNIAENSGKPFIIGEYGFPGWADDRVSTMYSALYAHAESIGLDGNQLWQLAADGTKCWEFGGNICYPGGRADTDLYFDFKNHVNSLKN